VREVVVVVVVVVVGPEIGRRCITSVSGIGHHCIPVIGKQCLYIGSGASRTVPDRMEVWDWELDWDSWQRPGK
jgi:hypothetical protein